MKRLDPKPFIGETFGRLTAIAVDGFRPKIGWMLRCACRCGKSKTVRLSYLKSGKTSSCGCYNREVSLSYSLKHGMSKTKIHRLWSSMMERCYKPYNHAYKNYGARGIFVEERWHKFAKFFEDMGHMPEGHSLERIDNDGPYSRENCAWVDRKTQARNRRGNNRISIDGKTKTLAEWCEIYGQKYKRAHQRITKRGWDPKQALEFGPLPRSYVRPRP